MLFRSELSPRVQQGPPVSVTGGTHTHTREVGVSVNPPGCNEQCWTTNYPVGWPPKSNPRQARYVRPLETGAALNVLLETARSSVSFTPTPSLSDLGRSESWRGHELGLLTSIATRRWPLMSAPQCAVSTQLTPRFTCVKSGVCCASCALTMADKAHGFIWGRTKFPAAARRRQQGFSP